MKEISPATLQTQMVVDGLMERWNPVTKVFDNIPIVSLDLHEFDPETDVYSFNTLSDNKINAYTGKFPFFFISC